MAQIVIIGSGPAGVSAALYTARAGLDTALITAGSGALSGAEIIENYYGAEKGISGKELESNGIEGAKRLGVEVINEQVVAIEAEDSFTVVTQNAAYRADAVIIASGAKRSRPKIKGLAEFEGRGVSYCAVCDAFFYRGKDVCVLGSGEYALHEAGILLEGCRSVTLLTNGEEVSIERDERLRIDDRRIAEITGEQRVENVVFENGEKLSISGVFIAVGVAGSTELANKLGIFTRDDTIVVDENCETNLPGVFAAGDCTGGLLQISKAVYQGAVAGLAAIKFVRQKSKG